METAFSTITSYLVSLESRITELEKEIASLRSTCAACPSSECCGAGSAPESTAPCVATSDSSAAPESAAPATSDSSAAPATSDSSAAPCIAPSEPAVADNEILFNLDKFSPDTIQNELWQQFRAASDSEKVSVIYFEGDYPHNVIVYANESTQPVYRNAAAGEVRVIQAIAGTHLLTLQPGESGKTCFTDGIWGPLKESLEEPC